MDRPYHDISAIDADDLNETTRRGTWVASIPLSVANGNIRILVHFLKEQTRASRATTLASQSMRLRT